MNAKAPVRVSQGCSAGATSACGQACTCKRGRKFRLQPWQSPKRSSRRPTAEAEPLDLVSRPAHSSAEAEGTEEQAEEETYLTRCVVDIAEQLKSVPAKRFPAVTPIVLAGCKLLIATWEAQAFVQDDETSKALQRTVAARTILHVCLERRKKNEPTDLAAAMDIARAQVERNEAARRSCKRSQEH